MKKESLSENFNHSFNIEVEDEEVEPSIANLHWSDDEDELEETPSVMVSPAIESDWEDEDEPDDRDVAAFQNIVSQAQANAAAQQTRFSAEGRKLAETNRAYANARTAVSSRKA